MPSRVAAALRRGHALPTYEGAGIAGEGKFQNGGEVAFGFHGGEQLFGDLLGAAGRGLRVFLRW